MSGLLILRADPMRKPQHNKRERQLHGPNKRTEKCGIIGQRFRQVETKSWTFWCTNMHQWKVLPTSSFGRRFFFCQVGMICIVCLPIHSGDAYLCIRFAEPVEVPLAWMIGYFVSIASIFFSEANSDDVSLRIFICLVSPSNLRLHVYIYPARFCLFSSLFIWQSACYN